MLNEYEKRLIAEWKKEANDGLNTIIEKIICLPSFQYKMYGAFVASVVIVTVGLPLICFVLAFDICDCVYRRLTNLVKKINN